MRVSLQADQFREHNPPRFITDQWIMLQGGNVMLVVKTVKVPVHYGITKRKLSILDSLTARTTYGVWLWSKLFKEHRLKGSYADRARFYMQVKKDAKLVSLTQCCFDTASWMWRSYREAHKAWRRNVAIARREGDKWWLRKLLRREPQEPFTNGMNGKVPIWFPIRGHCAPQRAKRVVV